MEDRLLVLKCKRGNTDALRRIYEKYKHDLLILAMALLNNKSEAEDVLHDVFISFVGNLKDFQLTGSLKNYLATCAANCARNKNKAKLSQNVSLDEAETFTLDSNTPDQSIICNEQSQRLNNAMTRLPPHPSPFDLILSKPNLLQC